jgi:very-short-patch-repair endonuclease
MFDKVAMIYLLCAGAQIVVGSELLSSLFMARLYGPGFYYQSWVGLLQCSMTDLQALMMERLFTDGKYDARRAKPKNLDRIPGFADLPGSCASEKVWLQFHTRPRCHCGNLTGYLDFTQGYRPYCSRKCIQYSPVNLFDKRHRHEKLWSNPEWAAQTALKMRESHFAANGANKLAKIAEKQITPLDPITSDRKKQIRWQHVCGEVFLKSFERPSALFCPKCHVSKGQGELYELIRKSYSGKIVANDRTAIAPKEIDIYLPALKLGFEFNGKYWHPGDGEREAQKSAEAAAAGITIIHVWEKEWVQKALRDKLVAQVLAAISCHGSPAL